LVREASPAIDLTISGPAVQMRPLAPVALLLAGLAGLVFLSRQSEPDILAYVLLLSASSALVTVLLWRQNSLSSSVVLVGAVLAHLVTFAGTPAFEDDWFRFIWDGWRTLKEGTPYGIAPDAFFDDNGVPSELWPILDGINNPEYPTIYGPALQYAFAGVFILFGTSPLGIQLLFAVANLALIALLLRRYKAGNVALYAWNPLVIVETSLHLHPDGLLGLALVAAILAGRGRPVLAGLLFGAAAGVKLVALAAWPMLLRWRPAALIAAVLTLALLYLLFLVQGRGAGFDSTATFATLWHFNPLLYEPLFQIFGWQAGRIPALLIAGLLVLWLHARSRSIEDVPLAAMFGVILLFAPAVNSWYLLWLLPFALGRNQIWPFVATIAFPFSYLTGINLGDTRLEAFAVHPLARVVECLILFAALFYDWRANRHADKNRAKSITSPFASPKIAAIMPALNEEASIGDVVSGIRKVLPENLMQVIVVDNGCTDNTTKVAQNAGAIVVIEADKGYGAACLTGIEWLDRDIDIVLFLDSDGSDVLKDAPEILEPIIGGRADLVIGSRALGQIEPGAMTLPQRFGNWLAPFLIRLIWDVHYTDLGPFRAIRRSSLDTLIMQDRDFGWTVEMQVRAAKLGLRTAEVPTSYRRRIGISKISGTINGVIRAGTKILYVIGREAFGDLDAANRGDGLSKPPKKASHGSR
jgi:hypothetical protein